jgi:hypothetical protein
MVGKVGMKGGGGARPNSGPKKKFPPAQKPAPEGADLLGEDPAPIVDPETTTIGAVQKDATPLDFLEATFRNPTAPDGIRLRAAIAAAQYRHTKRSDGGKKEADKAEAAKASKAGLYATGGAPKLASANGKKVA